MSRLGTIASVRRVVGLAAIPGGLIYRNAQYLAATVEIDAKAMKPWLPAGVRLADTHTADLFTAHFPDHTYGGPYCEAGLFVHIKTALGTTGIHCPWMLVNDDTPLILGRELLGYPKKMGDISWSIDGDEIRSSAGRQGTKLLSLNGTLGEVIENPPPILGRPHRNVIGTHAPYLVGFTPGEHVIEVRQAHLDVEISGTERDPIDQMGIGRVLEARLHRVNLSAGSPPVPLRPLTPLYTAAHLTPRVL